MVIVGVHQGSVLSPLLFIIVLEALSHEFRSGVPWELLYADDQAVMTDSLDECVTKLEAWKSGMETKGLRVNMRKTKLMVSGPGLDVLRDSGANQCAVCRSGGTMQIVGTCRCSDVCGRLVINSDYICPKCCGKARPIDGRPVTEVDVDDTLLDVEASFCYLGDMLCVLERDALLQSQPDVVQLGESSRNSCQSSC
jgi:hypothetical protein